MENKEPIGCGYCANESTCKKRVEAIAAYISNKDGIRDRFRNVGYTKYIAEHCDSFILAKGVKRKW